jgi:hypothetical protein
MCLVTLLKTDTNSALFVERFHPNTPQRLRGPLRLSTKYQVDDVRQHIVSILEAEWPTTLQGWDKLGDERENQGTTNSTCYLRIIVSIRLARECDIPSILPMAFYYLVTRFPTTASQELSMLARDLSL